MCCSITEKVCAVFLFRKFVVCIKRHAMFVDFKALHIIWPGHHLFHVESFLMIFLHTSHHLPSHPRFRETASSQYIYQKMSCECINRVKLRKIYLCRSVIWLTAQRILIDFLIRTPLQTFDYMYEKWGIKCSWNWPTNMWLNDGISNDSSHYHFEYCYESDFCSYYSRDWS